MIAEPNAIVALQAACSSLGFALGFIVGYIVRARRKERS